MRYKPEEKEKSAQASGGELYDALLPLAKGLGFSLVELSLSRQKKSVQIRAVIYKNGSIGVDDCSRFHHAALPRLELAFPGTDLYLEVSSPGIDRPIKYGREFAFFIGKGVSCFRTDISDWTGGLLREADEKGITLQCGEGQVTLAWDIIAKAKLNHAFE